MTAAVSPGQLRTILRRHAAGVAIVTTRTPQERQVGITVNTFTPVSLEPPLVSFCVGYTASARPEIQAAGRFVVSVLGGHQADLAARFATSGIDRFAGVDVIVGEDGLPRLPGAVTWLSCVTEATHRVGDHLLLIGRIATAESGPSDRPLVHHGGQLIDLRQPARVAA